MSKTRKPCPGCGQDTWRQADKVCTGCAAKLAAYDKLQEKEQQETEVVSLGHLPYIQDGSELLRDAWSREPCTFLHDAIRDLMEIVGRKRESNEEMLQATPICAIPRRLYQGKKPESPKILRSESCHSNFVCVPRGVREQIELIIRSVDEISTLRYFEGYRKGRNMLAQMATGELSLSEINQRVIGQGEVSFDDPRPFRIDEPGEDDDGGDQ